MAKPIGLVNKKPTPPKVEEEQYVCPHCGKLLKKSEFYTSSDPAVVIGIAFPCKDCIKRIARRYDKDTGEYGDCTVESIQLALEYLDKPFLQRVYDSSYHEVHDTSLKKNKASLWDGYIKTITSLYQYKGLRWKDGDTFKNQQVAATDTVQPQMQEIDAECERNRRDIIRLIGYDPFEKEAAEDKPLLYAQLIGYIDMGGDNEDMTRILDSIEIVRGYLQLQKINDMSAKAFASLSNNGNSGEIKNYMDTKKKLTDVISQLAEQSCISLKHSKNASKGENTFTGKTKHLKDMGLREFENNAFDIGTAAGMQQVADISNASILKQIRLDENDYTEMLAQQREMLTKLQADYDKAVEAVRILLRENIDLKDYLKEQGIDISELETKDTILYDGSGDK